MAIELRLAFQHNTGNGNISYYNCVLMLDLKRWTNQSAQTYQKGNKPSRAVPKLELSASKSPKRSPDTKNLVLTVKKAVPILFRVKLTLVQRDK